jgi:hypothetical protein
MLILARSAQTFLVKVAISALVWLSLLIALAICKIWG